MYFSETQVKLVCVSWYWIKTGIYKSIRTIVAVKTNRYDLNITASYLIDCILLQPRKIISIYLLDTQLVP